MSILEFGREREYYLVNMDNKIKTDFIDGEDQHLDEAALKDKYGPFWKLVQRNGAVRYLKEDVGRQELITDLERLYDEVLKIAEGNGIEVTHILEREKINVIPTPETHAIFRLKGSGSPNEGDSTRKEIGFLRDGENTEAIIGLVHAQLPISGDTSFARAQVLERDMLVLNSCLKEQSKFRIIDGAVQFVRPDSVSIVSGKKFDLTMPNTIMGTASLIRKLQ